MSDDKVEIIKNQTTEINNGGKVLSEKNIEERIQYISELNIDKDMAGALVLFAEAVVNKCSDFNSKECAKAIYLQKVINLKTIPDNYMKKIIIDMPNYSENPIVIEDSAGETGDSDSSKGASQDSNDHSASAGANGSGPPGTSLDKNIVILSYENGSYLVRGDFKPDYHVLERKDETQCFAYNPSYKPSETSETVSVGKKLSDVVQGVGKKLSNVAQGVGNNLSNVAQGVGNKLNNFVRVTQKNRGPHEELDESVDETNNPLLKLDSTSGGKLKTKKRRITKKRVQKRRPFKSRSKK